MTEEKINSFIEQTYLKRWITEDEIADAFIFLAKNDAMTGQVIYVDAGFTLKVRIFHFHLLGWNSWPR